MWPSGKQMRVAEKLYPCHKTTFSPPALIRRPPPSPRKSQATRLLTSRSPTEWVGRIVFSTQPTRVPPLRPAHACQLPIEPAEAGGGSGVLNDPADDHG